MFKLFRAAVRRLFKPSMCQICGDPAVQRGWPVCSKQACVDEWEARDAW